MNPFLENIRNYFLSRKAEVLIVVIGLIIVSVKFLLLNNNSTFFIVGDDPRRHLSVIESFIEHRAIVFPESVSGGYLAYVFYAPLFHIAIAVISILTGFSAQALQNLSPIVFLLSFFAISYHVMRLFIAERLNALAIAAMALIFFPIPAPNPHYLVYFALLPLAIFFMLKVLRERDPKKNLAWLFVVVLVMGLVHAQSIQFYFVSLSIALLFAVIFFSSSNDIRKMVFCWQTSALAYLGAFFLFSFITPTFWEAILHYFSLQLLPPDVSGEVFKIYEGLGFNRWVVLGLFAVIPAVFSGIVFFLSPRIEKLKHDLGEKHSKPLFLGLMRIPLILIVITGIVAVYFLIGGIILSALQFVMLFLFGPAIPYFARLIVFEKVYTTLFLGTYGYGGFAWPYSVGVSLLMIAAIWAILKLIRDRIFSRDPEAVLLVSFMVPFLANLLLFPFVRTSNYVNPLILDRFYFYTFISLVFFSAPFLLGLLNAKIENWKTLLPFAGIGLVFILVTSGSVFSSSVSVDPVQNLGYEWLVKNTPVQENAPQLNYDILGYYHVSAFPRHYALNLLGWTVAEVNLNQAGNVIRPEIVVRLPGFNDTIRPDVSFNQKEIGETDDKIFDNPKISFYREGQ